MAIWILRLSHLIPNCRFLNYVETLTIFVPLYYSLAIARLLVYSIWLGERSQPVIDCKPIESFTIFVFVFFYEASSANRITPIFVPRTLRGNNCDTGDITEGLTRSLEMFHRRPSLANKQVCIFLTLSTLFV